MGSVMEHPHPRPALTLPSMGMSTCSSSAAYGRRREEEEGERKRREGEEGRRGGMERRKRREGGRKKRRGKRKGESSISFLQSQETAKPHPLLKQILSPSHVLLLTGTQFLCTPSPSSLALSSL